MTKVVDSSVVLASMLGETGGEVLNAPDEVFHLSVVNLAEVHTKVCKRGGSIEDVRAFLGSLPIKLDLVDRWQAEEVGRLRPLTKHLGLSLGDRLCLAPGKQTGLPVLTAQSKWLQVDLGLDIRLIR